MKNFTVILTRNITESVSVPINNVETEDEAVEQALKEAGKYGTNIAGWETDEGNFFEVYSSDVHES